MDVAAHVDSVADAVRDGGERPFDEGGAARIIVGGDAVLGDIDRLAGLARGEADRPGQRLGAEFVAGVGHLGVRRGRQHSPGPDPHPRVGLDADEVALARHVEPGSAQLGAQIGRQLFAALGRLDMLERQADPDRIGTRARFQGGIGLGVSVEHDRLGAAGIGEQQRGIARRGAGLGGGGDHGLGGRAALRRPRHHGQQARNIGFVERGGGGDQASEATSDSFGITREQIGPVIHLEAAAHREPAWHGEVGERDDRRQAMFVAGFQHPAVMGEGRGRVAPLFRFDPRPFQSDPVAIETERGRQGDILGIAVIAVAGVAGRFAKQGGLYIFIQPAVRIDIVALGLMSRGGSAPQKARRRGERGAGVTGQIGLGLPHRGGDSR